MDMALARADMRRAHVGGAAGVFVSGLVWLVTGLVWRNTGPQEAFEVLFFGGVAIAPLARALTSLAFKPAPASVGKRLELIALMTVPVLLIGFLIAWQVYGMHSAKAIPVVAVAVGLRYLLFPAMFGDRTFLALGGIFIACGMLGLLGFVPPLANIALILGLTELAFGLVLYRRWQRS